jgi:hypothetical protein
MPEITKMNYPNFEVERTVIKAEARKLKVSYELIFPCTIHTEHDIKYYLNRYGSVGHTFTARLNASEDIHLLVNAVNKFQKLVIL